MLQEDIIKDSKNFKSSKCQNVKKTTDQLSIVQKDLQNCVQEFQRVKTEYLKEGDDKTNNRILKKSKKRIKPSASTSNAYVLAMITANTHQVTLVFLSPDIDIIKSHLCILFRYIWSTSTWQLQERYFHTDLQDSMKQLEMGVYQRIRQETVDSNIKHNAFHFY